MDMMEIRRKIIGLGGAFMIGEFSKYKKYDYTPSDQNEIWITHNIGTIPKLITVDGAIVTAGNFVKHFICDNTIGVGIDSSDTSAVWNVDITQIKHISGLVVYLSDTELVIRRQSSSRLFDSATTYKVEIYA